MKVLCIIPVFNEAEHLNGTIESIKKNNYGVDKFLFINSGSTDGTTEILENSEFDKLTLEKNLGIGFVLINGINFAIQNKFDVITFIHGGNKMDTKDFQKILDPILFQDKDCVWGSRFINETSFNMPLFRKAFTPLLSNLVSKFYKYKVTDATNGFRAYKIKYLLSILPKYDRKWLYGYGFESFLFGKMLNDKHSKKIEVPVTIRYSPTKKNTKIKPIIDWPQIVFPYFLAKFIK